MNQAQDKISIANYAINKIGGKRFNFGDGSDSDKTVSAIYDQCRRYCLEQCPWSFAVKTVALSTYAVPTTSPIFNFADGIIVAYAFPTDFLKPYRINSPTALTIAENVPGFGYSFLSDTLGLIVKYIFDNDDPTTYSAKFYEYLACKIAKEACFKLVEAAQYVGQMKAEMDSAFVEAAAEDGQIGAPEIVNDGYWEWSRLAGSNAAVGYPPNGQNVGLFPFPGIPDF